VATTTSAATAAPITKKQGRFLRILKWVLLGLVLLLVAAAICGAAYQAIANYRDEQRFPQEGRSVALGAAFPGVSLNINCTGQSGPGEPTVIMDTGLGVPAVLTVSLSALTVILVPVSASVCSSWKTSSPVFGFITLLTSIVTVAPSKRTRPAG